MATRLTTKGLASRSGRGTRTVRLLGVVPDAGPGLLAALAALPGLPVSAHPIGDLTLLLQPEPHPLPRSDRAKLLAALHTVQRRLEIACQAGPLLPVDPAAATCAAAALPKLLEQLQAAPLHAALDRHGRYHQWDVVLRWPAEPILADRRAEIAPGLTGDALAAAVGAVLRAERAAREAALVAALTPTVVALAPGGAVGTPTEVVLTVLLPAGGEAVIEAALGRLAAQHTAHAEADLRGPLPPLSFAALRVADTPVAAIAEAWRHLALDPAARVDAAALHRQWRHRAFALHPDRQPTPAFGTTLAETTAAYHLLRDLLCHDTPEPSSLADLSRRAGPRLVLPAAQAEPEFRRTLQAAE